MRYLYYLFLWGKFPPTPQPRAVRGVASTPSTGAQAPVTPPQRLFCVSFSKIVQEVTTHYAHVRKLLLHKSIKKV